MTSKPKPHSRLPPDWKAHMFCDNSSDDEDDMYDFSFVNHVTDDENWDDGSVATVRQQTIERSVSQSPGVHPTQALGLDRVQSAKNNTGSESGQHAFGVNGRMPLSTQASDKGAAMMSLCVKPQQMTSGQGGQQTIQDVAALLRVKDQNSASQPCTRLTTEVMMDTSVACSQLPSGNSISAVTVNLDRCQHPTRRPELSQHTTPMPMAGGLAGCQASKDSPQPTHEKNRRLLTKRLSTSDLDELVDSVHLRSPHEGGIRLGSSIVDNAQTSGAGISQSAKHGLIERRHTEMQFGSHLLMNTPHPVKPRPVFCQLNVQSLGVKAGHMTQYLPADEGEEEAVRKAEKTKGKSWDRLHAILRGKGRAGILSDAPHHKDDTAHEADTMKVKKTKGGSLWGRAVARSKLPGVSEDVYTVVGQMLPVEGSQPQCNTAALLEEGSPIKADSQRLNTDPILLTRRSRDTTHIPSAHPEALNSIASSDFILSRSPSPLMPEMVSKFDAHSDDTASDTSSVTSDSLGSLENGEGGEGGVRARRGEIKEKTEKRVGHMAGFGFKGNPALDADSEILEICPVDSRTERLQVTLQSEGSRGPQSTDGPYGKLFTARLCNSLGHKGLLSNVTHVSHVYHGTLLVTDLLSGQLLHMSPCGSVLKIFQVDPGAEPWCACVTPRGLLAVTLRRPACVTVWSGSRTLVQEFGHSVLQFPTGLACDRQGRFVVADERTNRVALFSPDGQFVRYLSVACPPGVSAQSVSSSIQESTFHMVDESFNNKENTTIDRSQDSIKTKKKVRLIMDNGEIHATNTDELLPQNEDNTVKKVSKNDGPSLAEYVFHLPRYVCISASGHIVVSDSASNSLKVFTPEGVYVRTIGGSGGKDGQLKVPYGVCCDQDNNVYVADHYNDRVSVFSLEGEFLQHAVTAVSGLCRPKSIAICPRRKRKLFVAHGGLRTTEVLVYDLESTPRYISFTYDL